MAWCCRLFFSSFFSCRLFSVSRAFSILSEGYLTANSMGYVVQRGFVSFQRDFVQEWHYEWALEAFWRYLFPAGLIARELCNCLKCNPCLSVSDWCLSGRSGYLLAECFRIHSGWLDKYTRRLRKLFFYCSVFGRRRWRSDYLHVVRELGYAMSHRTEWELSQV